MTLPAKNKFDPTLPVTGKDGNPSQTFSNYMTKFDALVAAMAAGNGPVLVNAANDVAARNAGVAVGQFYRNGSQVMIRVV